MKKSHLILPVIILVFVAVFAMISISDESSNTVQQETSSANKSNEDQPTEPQDTTESDQNLSNAAKASQDEQNNSSGASQVTPIITSWGAHSSNESYTVSSFVQGTVENGGMCNLAMKKGGDVYNAEKTATAGPQNTTCGAFEVPSSELSPGTWTITIEYVSANYQGVSDIVELEVL